MQDVFSIASKGQSKPATRTKTLGIRVSDSEFAALEQRAWTMGKTVTDLAREIILSEIQNTSAQATRMHIFTELVAVELALMNGLGPLLRGEKLSREQANQIFREVQATKATRAQEILLKRAHAGEE